MILGGVWTTILRWVSTLRWVGSPILGGISILWWIFVFWTFTVIIQRNVINVRRWFSIIEQLPFPVSFVDCQCRIYSIFTSNNNPKLYAFCVIYFVDIFNLLKLKSIVVSFTEDILRFIKKRSFFGRVKIGVFNFRTEWLRLLKATIFIITSFNNPWEDSGLADKDNLFILDISQQYTPNNNLSCNLNWVHKTNLKSILDNRAVCFAISLYVLVVVIFIYRISTVVFVHVPFSSLHEGLLVWLVVSLIISSYILIPS